MSFNYEVWGLTNANRKKIKGHRKAFWVNFTRIILKIMNLKKGVGIDHCNRK